MRSKRALLGGVTLLAAALVLGVTGVALADDDDGGAPTTDQARAALTGTDRISVEQTVCRGADGEYREALEVFRGTSTSDDPRLQGTLRLVIRSFINRSPDQQEGTVEGRIVIRDEATDRKKVEARFFAVSDDAATLEGLLIGRVKGRGDDRDERFFANFFGRFDAMDNDVDFAVTLGQEPETDSARNSAVIQRGECPGGPGAPRGLGGHNDRNDDEGDDD